MVGSKTIPFEKFKEINHLPRGWRMTHRYSPDFDDDIFYMMDPGSSIDHEKFMLKLSTSEMKREEDHVEFLSNSIIKELEEDEESRIFSDGKLFLSSFFEDFKESFNKAKKNTKARIYRLKNKIKEREDTIADFEKLLIIFNDLEEKKNG